MLHRCQCCLTSCVMSRKHPTHCSPLSAPAAQAYTALLAQCGGSYREREQLAAFIKGVEVCSWLLGPAMCLAAACMHRSVWRAGAPSLGLLTASSACLAALLTDLELARSIHSLHLMLPSGSTSCCQQAASPTLPPPLAALWPHQERGGPADQPPAALGGGNLPGGARGGGVFRGGAWGPGRGACSGCHMGGREAMPVAWCSHCPAPPKLRGGTAWEGKGPPSGLRTHVWPRRRRGARPPSYAPPWLQCIEDCEERFEEAQIEELLQLVQEHLAA